MKADGSEYYEYVLCYVDDILSISHDPMKTMKKIQEDFKLKNDRIAESDMYLGATLSKMKLANGKVCWTMSPCLLFLLCTGLSTVLYMAL